MLSKTPSHPHLAEAIERNIKALAEVRAQMERSKSIQDRFADAITKFAGSITFVYLNALWFTVWVLLNTRIIDIEPFDPYPFSFLTMAVSLEAIFLATFVLITQNRMSRMADQRADLDLHIDLLAEYEITKILKLIDAVVDHLKLPEGKDQELQQLKQEVTPERLLQEIEDQNGRRRLY